MNPYLDSLTPVWQEPTSVFINTDKLEKFAHQICSEDFPVPGWTEPVFPDSSDEIFVNFIGVGNAINFAFSDFETRLPFTATYQCQEWAGAFGMWACLKKALDAGADFKNLDWLSALSSSDFPK